MYFEELFMLQVFFTKNMHGNKNDDFLSIIHIYNTDLIVSLHFDRNGGK